MHGGAYVVLASDEVYPLGSPAEYENRFIGPYKAALPWTDAARAIFSRRRATST